MLSDDRIFEIAEAYGALDSEHRRAEFARAIEAEVRKQDDDLILQMLGALEEAIELLDVVSPFECDTTRKTRKAITAARKRLEGTP